MTDRDGDSDVEMLPVLPTSSSDSSTLNLDDKEMTLLNEEMNKKSSCFSSDDDKGLETVLFLLSWELSTTSVKSKVIGRSDVEEKFRKLNDEERKTWREVKLRCMEKGDWTDLINFSKIKVQKLPNVAQGVPMELKEAVVNAWECPYLGDAHKTLLQAVDELYLSSKKHYARIIPVVQSSGMGKSKTGDRTARDRILFPMCLREDLGNDLFAYPLPDDIVRDHLWSAPSTDNESEVKEYLEIFLSSLFIEAHSLLQKSFFGNGMRVRTYEDIAEFFYNLFKDEERRTAFYTEVVDHANDRPDRDCKKHITCFTENLRRCCSNWPTNSCPVLISIDEVHSLYTFRSSDKKKVHSLYSLFKSVLSGLVSCKFVVICMSTASHISSLAPSRSTAPSFRERGKEICLPAPFTELSFDVYLHSNPLAPGQETLESVGSLEFTAKFGRPLFYSTYCSRMRNLDKFPGRDIKNDILSMVQEKLSGRSWPPGPNEDPLVLNAMSIGILSARLQLSLYPAAVSARDYAEELVRNHLRMLYSVHHDLHTIMTGSSPEPLVAEASALIMNYVLESRKPYMELWTLLWQYIDHGLAAQGAIGELIGRALSISAMDRAINSLVSKQDNPNCELLYQTPVTVTDYYKALLTKDAWEELRHTLPANYVQLDTAVAEITFEKAFEKGYFHFSHYGQANDISPLQSQYAWAYWLRGTAIACQLNQELTDRMTPIYFPDQGPVSPRSISVNLDQDKTSQSVSPPNVSIQSAEHLSIFPDGTKLPYIAAVHCYALTDSDMGIKPEPGPSERLQQTRKLRSSLGNSEAPRYQINFYGLNAYDGIAEEERAIIRRMIDRSKDALFANHPREYGVPSVRQMLPLLSRDPDAMKWIAGSNQDTASGRVNPGTSLKRALPATATSSSTAVPTSAAGSRGQKRKKMSGSQV